MLSYSFIFLFNKRSFALTMQIKTQTKIEYGKFITMEIQLTQKEFDKNDQMIHDFISKDLKEIKTIFIDLYHKNDPLAIDVHSESIDTRFRDLSRKLPINQRKVLKAYLDFQLEDASEKMSLKEDRPNRREKSNFSFFPTLKNGRISPNQNKLLEVFKNWLMVNMRLAKGMEKKKEIFLKQLSEAQELLNLFFERIMQDKQSSSSQQKQKYCEVTLVLILITQFNLCVFLLFRRNYSSAKVLTQKFKLTFDILKKQNSQRQVEILKNMKIIEELHKEQEKQVRQYLFNNRVSSLRALNSHKKYPENDGLKEARQQAGQQKINQKYNKAIDQLIERNRTVSYEQEKINLFLQDIEERMLRLENTLLFQTETDDIDEKLKHTSMKIKLFANQKLNNTLQQFVMAKDQPNKKTSICEVIFSHKSTSSQDMFLSVTRGRKNLEISIKDYFNLCMFMKKAHTNKEAIIYFEILVFHYKKKNIIIRCCLKGDFLGDIEDDDELSEEERLYAEERAAMKQFEQFVRNEELIKIVIFSLVSLIELYELQNAHHWAVQTLNYTSKLIEFKVIHVLEKICSKLNIFNSFDGENQYGGENLSKQQKQCVKLIKKYSAYLEEIKYKIIKTSFNSLTSQIIHRTSLQNRQSQKKINLNISSAQKTSLTQTFRKTTQLPLSYNMQRLHEKQNQLQSLIQSRSGSLNQSERFCQTGIQTPIQKIEFNKVNDLEKLKTKRNIMTKNQLKGSSYQIKKKLMKVQRTSDKNDSTKESTNFLGMSKKQSKKQDFKQSVKFNLSTPIQFQSPSCALIKTFKYIGMKSTNKNTVNFLETEKTLDESRKKTRMFEARKKILESKEQLQDHIKLCFMKINGCTSNAFCSTISLDDAHAQNYDFTSQTDEVLHEFDELLLGLKTLRSHAEESFQREILIEAKVKLLEMIKPKSRHQKLIEVCVGLVNDINLLKNTQKRIQLKKKILWELSQNYQATKEVKKAISAFLELARLGDSIGYLKIGEIYMNMKDYANSIKFHEKYATQKNFDLSSKVKLTHAYSKVPQYYMKTVDMLSGILIAPGSSSKFKQEIIERRYDDRLIESAVILLSSLHFKNENIQKAIELCENYCKVNIKNYRVLHILGGYYRFKGNNKKSFECYLNALENNPTHHKSLIELTEFICKGAEYKSHAIQLLRKCFCMESKNFELLSTLVKFLVDGNVNHDEQQKQQLNYNTLIKYAEILNQSHTKGYSGQNFYEQASLVYEWALNLLDKSVSIANLDQIQQIYRNLGQICLKRGDYARSQSYYKLYLIEIEKYVNRSKINEQLRQEKINKTKIMIYHFLGKVKKHQQSFKKAISYFNKSFDLQEQYQQKLPNLESYFHLFEIGQCYFMLESYEVAFRKFAEHRDHLLYFISIFDEGFFNEERREDLRVAGYLEMREKKVVQKKINYLKKWINGHNQSSQTQLQEEKNNTEQVEYILKKKYFQNQLYTAFCCDKRRQFIESKQIYKKILLFIKEVELTIKSRQKLRNSGKKYDAKEQQDKIRQNYIKHITLNYVVLNADYKGFKMISMINLANIYRIEGLDSKYHELIRECSEQFPQSLTQNEIGKLVISSKISSEHQNSEFTIKQTDQSLNSVQGECIKTFKKTLDNLDRVKEKKIHFFNEQGVDKIRESIDSFFKIPSQYNQKSSLNELIKS